MNVGFDPYIDPTTGILANRIGARTKATLEQAESALSGQRLVELAERYSVRPSADLDELCGIHRHLFQDIYEWAGQIRTGDLRRRGGEPFLPGSAIEGGTRFVFNQLRVERHLLGLSRTNFVERLAYHYDALNYAHPFREGNGRTQRVFWSRVARDAGWDLNWQEVTAARNNEASRAAREGSDLRLLREMFEAITSDHASRPRSGRRGLDLPRLKVGKSNTPTGGPSHQEQRAGRAAGPGAGR